MKVRGLGIWHLWAVEAEQILPRIDKPAEVEHKKQQTFRKFTYRSVDLDQLLDALWAASAAVQCPAAALNPGLKRKKHSLLKGLCKAKKEAPPMEKPEVVVKTQLRDLLTLREMVGNMVGVWQDLQSGGNQVWDDWPLPGWVLHHVQASEAPAGLASETPTPPASSLFK